MNRSGENERTTPPKAEPEPGDGSDQRERQMNANSARSTRRARGRAAVDRHQSRCCIGMNYGLPAGSVFSCLSQSRSGWLTKAIASRDSRRARKGTPLASAGQIDHGQESRFAGRLSRERVALAPSLVRRAFCVATPPGGHAPCQPGWAFRGERSLAPSKNACATGDHSP